MHLLRWKLIVKSNFQPTVICQPGDGGRLHGCSRQVCPGIRCKWRNLDVGGQTNTTAVMWRWGTARPSTQGCSAANTGTDPKTRPLFMYMSQVRHYWAFFCCILLHLFFFFVAVSLLLQWAELPFTPSHLLFLSPGYTGCSGPIIS